MSKKNLYYKYHRIMSFNIPIMAIIGGRGIGKTYGAKRYAIKKFIQEGKKFIWIRDTETACDELRHNDGEKFFTDVSKEFERCVGNIKGEVISINDKHAGYLMPMSTYYNYKGNAYDDIELIIVDEFIPEKYQRNAGNRALQFVNTVETIGRLRDNYKIIMLANSLSRGDEILKIFGVKIRDYGFYFNKRKGMVIHYADNNPHFDEAKKNSIAGKLLLNTPFEDTLTKNKFNDDEQIFFDRMPSKSKLLCILHSDYDATRVYLHEDKFYCRADFNPDAHKNIRFVNELELVDSEKSMISRPVLDGIKKAFSNNMVLFENAYMRKVFLDVVG